MKKAPNVPAGPVDAMQDCENLLPLLIRSREALLTESPGNALTEVVTDIYLPAGEVAAWLKAAVCEFYLPDSYTRPSK
jgi:hypothetical protein